MAEKAILREGTGGAYGRACGPGGHPLPLGHTACYGGSMKTPEPFDETIAEMGAQARKAVAALTETGDAANRQALDRAAAALQDEGAAIRDANAADMAAGQSAGLSDAMLDRLRIDEGRLNAIAGAVRAVAALDSPVGKKIDERTGANGLAFSRVRVPLGVVGIIYESRPNVTADAAALCIRSGNAAILRGGSEARATNRAIHGAFVAGLASAGLPAVAVQMLPTQDREAVGAMLRAQDSIDVIVPRGGKGLVARVQADARVPVLAHLNGNNHIYVAADADPAMAEAIVVNAKMRRPGVCGAMETLLVDREFAEPARLIAALIDAGCEVRADDMLMELDPRSVSAHAADWDTEYLDAVVAARMVADVDEAVAHIAQHGSGHTDVIVTQSDARADRFTARVDSAIVMVNASSQFADGGEFGLGAEIGIATGRLHARGPVALEGLTTYKWIVRGAGQVRP